MTLSALTSQVSFALQSAKIGKNGTPSDVLDEDWYKILVGRNTVGPVQGNQILPPLIGGAPTPRSAFKQSVFFGVDLETYPFLERVFGWLLLGALGSGSDVANKDSNGATVAGLHTHIFRFEPTNPVSLPWMAFRRVIRGASAEDDQGLVGYDCKITGLRIIVPASGKMAFSLQATGRSYFDDEDVADWAYTNTEFDVLETAPDAGRGYLKFGGQELETIGFTMEVDNGLSTPQQEMVVGSFNPVDFITAARRQVTLRFTAKYSDPELYRQVLTGETDGTEWNSLPFIKATVGSDYAFDFALEAPQDVGVTNHAHRFRVRGNRAVLQEVSPIELQPGGYVTQDFSLTILQANSNAVDYVHFIVENGVTTYALPTP